MKISAESKKKAQIQIRELQSEIKFDTRDLPAAYLAAKYREKSYFKPAYQREVVWGPDRKCRFVESLLLRYPIPMLFLAESQADGKLEIVDGLQRISTIDSFLNDELTLSGLKKLTLLNGFSFSDLTITDRNRLEDQALRVTVLDRDTSEIVKIDLFDRINTSSLKLEDAEVRAGAYGLNPMMQLIINLSDDPEFVEFTQLSQKRLARKENTELLSRFFAFSYNYKGFSHSVKDFINDFITIQGEDSKWDNKQKESKQTEKYTSELFSTISFIKENYPENVFKGPSGLFSRLRFEAIMVGTNLAIKKTNGSLEGNSQAIQKMLNSDKFQFLTLSGGANSKPKVQERIEFVRNTLLEASK